MKERSRNAWLVTWERFGDSEPVGRTKIVSILPYRTPVRVITDALPALFVAVYPLSIAEKFHFGLDGEQRRLCRHAAGPERFLFGVGSEQLYARRVKDLHRKFLDDGSLELTWTELPRYQFDEAQQKVVEVLKGRGESVRELPSDANEA
jgi:hypothetical protein